MVIFAGKCAPFLWFPFISHPVVRVTLSRFVFMLSKGLVEDGSAGDAQGCVKAVSLTLHLMSDLHPRDCDGSEHLVLARLFELGSRSTRITPPSFVSLLPSPLTMLASIAHSPSFCRLVSGPRCWPLRLTIVFR